MNRLEKLIIPNPLYMDEQKDISPKMREILVDWIIEVHKTFRLCPHTLYGSVNIVDRFLSVRQISRKNYQLVGVAAMSLAAKILEHTYPAIQDYTYICDEAYDNWELIEMEKQIVNALDYNMIIVTPLDFLNLDGMDIEKVKLIKYLTEVPLQMYDMIQYLPSEIASAAREIADAYPNGTVRSPCALQILRKAQSPNLSYDAIRQKYSQKNDKSFRHMHADINTSRNVVVSNTTKEPRFVKDASNYKKIIKIGDGSYSRVYKAKDIRNNKIVTYKKLPIYEDGISHAALREITILRTIGFTDGPRVIIKLLDVFIKKDYCVQILEHLPENLFDYIEREKPIPVQTVREILQKVLQAVEHIHSLEIVHRDIKSTNILIDQKTNEVRLIDFNLARQICHKITSKVGVLGYKMTNEVCTLNYRPPELILGLDEYDGSIDIWSVGCLFYKLMTGSILFNSDCEIDHLYNIFKQFGTPEAKLFGHLPNWNDKFPKWKGKELKVIRLNEQGKDLMEKMLAMDPKKRITASEALRHPYFTE